MSPRSLTLAGLLVLLSAGGAVAQRPADTRNPDTHAAEARSTTTGDVSLAELKPTPEMWFYLQERQRYDNPKYAVRRNAELDAARRSDRIASMQWFGISPERPAVSHTIFSGLYPSITPYDGMTPWNFYYSVRTTRPQPPQH